MGYPGCRHIDMMRRLAVPSRASCAAGRSLCRRRSDWRLRTWGRVATIPAMLSPSRRAEGPLHPYELESPNRRVCKDVQSNKVLQSESRMRIYRQQFLYSRRYLDAFRGIMGRARVSGDIRYRPERIFTPRPCGFKRPPLRQASSSPSSRGRTRRPRSVSQASYRTKRA
jgi:hypothetical protein